ncbi:DNA-processing protein DprA [Streptomyces sp. NPDC058373]|uniref:DNA-processing protein DprA n=1 Tax=unclassified Streptomyces TaxID=2593676 RepID=UPI00365F5A78
MTAPDAGGLFSAQGPATGSERKARTEDSDRFARAGLTRVLEPGDPRGGQWLRSMGPAALLDRLRGEGPPLPGATAGRMAGLRLRAQQARPELDLAVAREAGARFVCPGDAEWPAQLDDLGDARPVGLWVRGTPWLRFWALRSVALVGARACTDYGAHAAGLLGAGLAERGWVVVSGGAYGIDGAAHRAVLGAGGATVAVLASGVDSPYPRGHAQLIARIAEQGLVVSELPPGEHPTPSRFVLRNRVIAALTRGTVVVEAAHRSGALSTARAALRLGRAAMGVPGPVTSSLSAGVHELLRGEGHLVADAGDVIELVGGIGELAPVKSGPVLPRDLLPERLGQALEAVPGGAGGALEQIARAAATSVDETVGNLYELMALGYVERRGKNWKLTRQALSGGFPTCDDPVAKVPSCPDHAP